MSAATKLLDKLERTKQTRPGNWVAACPCCQSKRGRPLSLRELEDGRVLLNAFCGCKTEAVLGALGLTLADLFERPVGQHFAQSRSRIPARDLLAVIDHEVTVAALILLDVLHTKSADAEQWARLALAVSRIGRAREHGNA